MPWQMIIVIAMLAGLLGFGLVGYWRGKRVSCGCTRRDRVRTEKSR